MYIVEENIISCGHFVGGIIMMFHFITLTINSLKFLDSWYIQCCIWTTCTRQLCLTVQKCLFVHTTTITPYEYSVSNIYTVLLTVHCTTGRVPDSYIMYLYLLVASQIDYSLILPSPVKHWKNQSSIINNAKYILNQGLSTST